MPPSYVEIESMREFTLRIFMQLGFSAEAAGKAANVLIFSDQRGFRSHGVSNLHRIYVPKIRDGAINPSAQPRVLVEEGSVARIDAQRSLGLVAATDAMDLAAAIARRTGIGLVVVRNSSHFGCASFYSVRAQEQGMIGIAMSNLGSQAVARPPDGKLRMLGSNPLSVAAPAGKLPAFALDMSTTAVSTGRIRIAQQTKAAIPAGWLVDGTGLPVTDPEAFSSGHAELQMLGGDGEAGGYKGYGLALAVDILSGILSGAQVGPNPGRLIPGTRVQDSTDQDIGHLFIAIEIARLRPLSEFQGAMDTMLGTLLSSPSREGKDAVLYPGYLESRPQAPLHGCITLDAEDVTSLLRLASELNVTFPMLFQHQPVAVAEEDVWCNSGW